MLYFIALGHLIIFPSVIYKVLRHFEFDNEDSVTAAGFVGLILTCGFTLLAGSYVS